MKFDALPSYQTGHIAFFTEADGEQKVFVQSACVGTIYLDTEANSYAFKSLQGNVTLLDSSVEINAKQLLRNLLLG